MKKSAISVPATEFQGLRIKPSNIEVVWEENQSRAFPYTPEDVTDLIQDFEEGKEINQPLTVEKRGTLPHLIAGFRRLYVALQWEKDHPDFTVPVLFVTLDKENPTLDALTLNARENIARKDLTPIDLGHLAEAFEAQGLSNAATALKLGVSEAQVTQHKKLVKEFPEFIQRLIHKRTITADDAFTLLKVPLESRMEALNRFLSAKGTQILENAGESAGEAPESQEYTFQEEPQGQESGRDEETPPPTRPVTMRQAAREAGGDVGTLRMPEWKKYLKEAIETEGPGSNPGEVALKKAVLKFLDGKLTEKQMDNAFNKYCKERI